MSIVLAAINAKWIHPSLALRLLKANLGHFENQCEILEFALRQPLKEKIEPILAARPRILGFSVSIWNHPATLELLEALKKKWEPGHQPLSSERPIIVLGGPEVSWLPEDAEIFRYADYVIRGEGEESFRLLCSEILGEKYELNKAQNKNTFFINKGDTSVNINEIETAYHLYTNEDLQKKLVYVEASRGCPFSCAFCQGGLQKTRYFPLGPFLNSMGTLIDRGVKTFKFLDRSFNTNPQRAKQIMEFFLERIEAGALVCVHFEMVPSRIPSELKESLCRFPPGTLRLELGIQTLNCETAKLINRSGFSDSQSCAASLETLNFLRRETNAILHVDLIAGLPAEDLASFALGFDRLWLSLSENGSQALPDEKASHSNEKANQVCEIQLGILKCLPGTSIIRHNETHGMKYSPQPPYEVIETSALPAADLDKIKNFARFWEVIVNRNPFPDLTPQLLPPGKPVFNKFMKFSDRLFEHFGKNWGIDRKDLRLFMEKNLQDL